MQWHRRGGTPSLAHFFIHRRFFLIILDWSVCYLFTHVMGPPFSDKQEQTTTVSPFSDGCLRAVDYRVWLI